MSLARRLRGLSRIVLVCLFVAVAGFPVYWLFVTATQTTTQLFGGPIQMLPDLGNFASSFGHAASFGPMLRWLSNSAVVAIGTTILSLALAIPSAFALSQYRFRGKSTFSFVLFSTQMLPEALLVVPLYAIFVQFGLLNRLMGLVLADTVFAMVVVVWIIKSAIDAIPFEILESARIDGCPRYAILPEVAIPLIGPSIAAAAVIAFLDGWNEFLFANTFIIDESKWPASKGLASFIGEYLTPLNDVMAAAIMFTVPAIVFFLVVQRRIVSGLTAGSVKG